MARERRSFQEPLLKRVLARARELAEEVRETAERVHQQAKEAHRLTQIAHRHAERGRELSKAGRDEARRAVNSIEWGVDTAADGRSCRSGGEDEADRPPSEPSLP
jgi:RNA polymerase-binding transcription factor DksA